MKRVWKSVGLICPLILVLLLSMVSCSIPLTENPIETGTVKFYLTNFTPNDKKVAEGEDVEDVEKVMVNIMRVDIHSETNGWQPAVESPKGNPYNLLELVDNVALVGVTELDAGLYTQIRLILGADNTILVGGESLPLTIPSGEETGIKLIRKFEVEEDGTVSIILDFDAEKSIHITGSGKYILKPTITVKDVIPVIPPILFSDDFESYEVGEYPEANDWNILLSGKGDQYTYVVGNVAHSGDNSFKLYGDTGLARSDGITLDLSGLDTLTYEAAVMISSGSDTGAEIGFFKDNTIINAVRLVPGSEITAVGVGGGFTDVWCFADTWYSIKVKLDYVKNTMDVWIDGDQKIFDLKANSKDMSNIFSISTIKAYGGVVYYDDIAIY